MAMTTGKKQPVTGGAMRGGDLVMGPPKSDRERGYVSAGAGLQRERSGSGNTGKAATFQNQGKPGR